MTVSLREPSSAPVAETAVEVLTDQVVPMGPVHCGSHMAISAGPAFDDSFVELLIDDLNGSVDLSIGHSQLMRNQLYEQVDPFNKRCAGRYGSGRR